MKHLKQIVAIITCCTIVSIDAKQVGKKTTPVIQPQPQPVPIPNIQPRPQPKPAPQPQQKAPQKKYTQILNDLQNMQPTHDDWYVLRDIKYEVEKQMGKIYDPALAKKPAPKSKVNYGQAKDLTMEHTNYAIKLFKKDDINLNKTQEACTAAAMSDIDIFTDEEQRDIAESIGKVVKDFLTEFSGISSQAIYDAIIFVHPAFIDLRSKLTQDQYDDIIKFIKRAVDKWYDWHKKYM
jgi:hypothetical protein